MLTYTNRDKTVCDLFQPVAVCSYVTICFPFTKEHIYGVFRVKKVSGHDISVGNYENNDISLEFIVLIK